MGEKTVKRRIFLSNAFMVLVTLVIFLIINVCVVKIYSESVEAELMSSVEKLIDKDDLEEFIEDWTIHRNEFVLLFLADGIICIVVLVIISQLFTKNLTDHILEPLDILSDGAKRIRANNLEEDISYLGDIEFENVCDTFNEMQKHILIEREKNRKYEKARTDMIAGISHDLRTPLTAIRGTIKGLMDGVASTPEKQERFLETAYRRTGDMDLLLNQLFYLSKIETDNMPVALRKIEISSFVQNYVQAKKGLMESAKEELTAETKEITAEVTVDPEQLQRIFDNLLENSRKYGEKIPLKMKMDLKKTSEGILIRFCDNGVGVPEDKLQYIFDEFYRVDESRNKKEGNGLGLYIVKYLIEAMGGVVWAENAEGLVVSMELPVAGKE
ncbi:MAG: sensor histidine kinase [Oliverpabstia sp.]